jgi:hypothetical protein
VFDGRTTSTYGIITSLPKPKPTNEQNAGYAKINIAKIKEILEIFDVTYFFRQKRRRLMSNRKKKLATYYMLLKVRDMNAPN